MLTGIGLRNFKAFGDEMQEAPLSKITLIYGPNSGGKSSIIQALLLLKQSLMKGYGLSARRALAPIGEFADLGSFQSLLHKHDVERKVSIAVKYRNLDLRLDAAENSINLLYSLEELSEIIYKITSYIDKRKLLHTVIKPVKGHDSWNARFKVMNTDGDRLVEFHDDSFLPFLSFPEFDRRREQAQELAQEQAQAQELARAQEQELALVQELILVVKQEKEQELITALSEKVALANVQKVKLERAQELVLALKSESLNLLPEEVVDLSPEKIPQDYERHLHSVNYLAPLRSAPQRIYTHSSADDGTTGIEGEYSANVLARDPDGVETEVNRWFRQFEIPYDIHARKWDEASPVGEFIIIELMPLDKDGYILDEDFAVTLADVGYGINQILPVIIEGIASQEGAILCVEQPEIHLHPRLQANIADLMIDTIAAEPGKRKQWIVETHSELLILRLQRRIREGKIKPEDISVLYVDPNDNSVEGSAIKVLRLGEDSYFKDPWPDGFFDEGLRERLPNDDELEGADDDTNILDKLFSE